MVLRYTANALTFVLFLGIIYIGASYLIAPETSASGFGLPSWPDGEAAAFLNIKGVRDITFGVVPMTLFALGQRRALGWVLLVTALVPLGDGAVILAWGGSTAAAFGIHFATAAACVATGLLHLRVARRAETHADRGGLAKAGPEPELA